MKRSQRLRQAIEAHWQEIERVVDGKGVQEARLIFRFGPTETRVKLQCDRSFGPVVESNHVGSVVDSA